jgi:hypothetical protein
MQAYVHAPSPPDHSAAGEFAVEYPFQLIGDLPRAEPL